MESLVLRNGPALRRAAILATVFLLPVVFLWDVTYDPFNVPKYALLVACVSVVASIRVAEAVLGRTFSTLSGLWLPAAATALPLVVAWLASPYRAWSLLGQYSRYEGLIPYLLLIALGLFTAEAFSGSPRALAWAFGAAGGAVGLYAFMQSVGVDPIGVPIVEFTPSTIGHSNFAAGFLGVTLPVSMALWGERRPQNFVALALSVLIGLGLVFTLSQGGWAGGIAGVALFAGFALRPRWSWTRPLGVAVAMVVALGITAYVIYGMVNPFGPLVGDTTRARGLWWQEAISMAGDSPIVGRGPNVFAVEGSHYRSAEDALAHGPAYTDSPHSVPLSALANAGVLGLIGYVLVLGWVVRRGSRLEPENVLGAGFCAALGAYFVQSLVSLDNLILGFALWVCLGGMTASMKPVSDPPAPVGDAKASLGRKLVAVLVLVAIVAPVWWAIRFVANDIRAADAIELAEDGRIEEARPRFEEVLEVRDEYFYRRQYGNALGIEALDEGLDGREYVIEMNDVFSYVADLPKVDGYALYGLRLHQWSVFDLDSDRAAVPILETALSLDPYNPVVRLITAEALLHLNDLTGAEEVIRPMIPLISEEYPEYGRGYPALWAFLAMAQLKQGEVEEGRESLNQALELARGLGTQNLDCYVLVARQQLRIINDDGDPRILPGLRVCNRNILELLPPSHRPRLVDDT
ncbi:MAG: O-antigen ligase family protein [Actinomycetota bacterium]|nr:O-antigen ligase family protein [Actinomycetota bacterium]